MNKQEYFQKREDLNSQKPKIKFGSKPTQEQKNKSSFINLELKKLTDKYIEASKPCNLNDNVEMVLNSGRKVKGIVTDFGILHDGNVHPIAYKEGSHTKHITVPIQSLKVI